MCLVLFCVAINSVYNIEILQLINFSECSWKDLMSSFVWCKINHEILFLYVRNYPGVYILHENHFFSLPPSDFHFFPYSMISTKFTPYTMAPGYFFIFFSIFPFFPPPTVGGGQNAEYTPLHKVEEITDGVLLLLADMAFFIVLVASVPKKLYAPDPWHFFSLFL